MGTESIVYEEDKKVPHCPECKTPVVKMCDSDHVCTCALEISSGMFLCPTCGVPICPCGAHDCTVISRVTGYLQDIKGWNSGKRAELMDRHRTTVGDLTAF